MLKHCTLSSRLSFLFYFFIPLYSGFCRPLVWGGLFLRATNGELNFGVDYGFPYYNDHHFHLGYFLYAAAYYVKHHRSWGDGEATL